jgi:WD40 repeat protein
VVQLGYAASMQLAPQWDSERAAQVSTIPMTPTYPYDYAPATPVLDTAIALRPDGRELASFSGGSTVDLFDTANGRRVASLIPRVGPHWFSGRTALLRWAPDGADLLLASGILGSVTVWRR